MANLERLWAPWRQEFVSAKKRPRGCFFCAAKRSSKDRVNHVVIRGKHTLGILNRYPYNNGHVMIAPYRHVGKMEALKSEEWMDLWRLSQSIIKKLKKSLNPQGFNLGMNLGRIAGAGLPGHLHLHIVPRWQGDTNVMPIVGNTKVVSQSLDELYSVLRNDPPTRASAEGGSDNAIA